METGRRRWIQGAGTFAAVAAVGLTVRAQSPKVIKVVARKYVFLPAKIRLQLGVPVTLQFTSADVVMGFSLPDFKIRTDIIPGQVSELSFTPDKVGSFIFLCDLFCGDGHEGMSGELVVG